MPKGGLTTPFRNLYKWSPSLAIAGWIHVALLIGALIAFPLDHRLILGINPWVKPLKFDVSTLLFLWTMSWYLGQLPPRKTVRRLGLVMAISLVFENLIITMQSARGTTSHFNSDSAFDAILFGVMGLFIVMNTVAATWTLVCYVREKTALSPAVLTGAQWGLLLFLVSSAVGGVMVAFGSHTVGGPDGGPGLPFLTWSTKYGDLRWAHFTGMHGLQVLPLTGYFLQKKALVTGVFTAMLAIVVISFVVALQGRPLLPM
jgi:hypothetical protein